MQGCGAQIGETLACGIGLICLVLLKLFKKKYSNYPVIRVGLI